MDLSELERLENPAKVLKLSEAIRIGAKIRPQGHGGMPEQIKKGTSCALLAACEAMYGWLPWDKLITHNPYLSDGYPMGLAETIYHWNDKDGMTREAIADRLEAMGY